MTVISPTFDVQDWLPAFISFGVIFIFFLIPSVLHLVKFLHIRDFFVFSLTGFVVSISVGFLVMVLHGATHHDNMVNDLEKRFEDRYDLTIVDNTLGRDIPLTPGDRAEVVKVFLHELPEEQTIIVEIVNDKYVVTHNGNVRDVKNY